MKDLILDAETQFLAGLLEFQYGLPVEKKLRALAPQVPWAKGWPQDTRAFWNAEAFLWERKIPAETRAFLVRELAFLREGKNLDVGCGAYSYVPGSVGLDISELMLRRNEQCRQKVIHDLRTPFPFPAQSFDSVTAIFVLNYLSASKVLEEILRVLKPQGTLVAVLSSTPVRKWQRQKEVRALSREEWTELLQKAGFSVTSSVKQGLCFFEGSGTKKKKGAV